MIKLQMLLCKTFHTTETIWFIIEIGIEHYYMPGFNGSYDFRNHRSHWNIGCWINIGWLVLEFTKLIISSTVNTSSLYYQAFLPLTHYNCRSIVATLVANFKLINNLRIYVLYASMTEMPRWDQFYDWTRGLKCLSLNEGLCNLCLRVHVCFFSIYTSEVQIVGRVDDNPHQGEVESSHLGSDLGFNTAMVKIMGTQQAVDGIDGLSLDLSPVNTHAHFKKFYHFHQVYRFQIFTEVIYCTSLAVWVKWLSFVCHVWSIYKGKSIMYEHWKKVDRTLHTLQFCNKKVIQRWIS